MKKKLILRVLAITGSIFLLLVGVLAVHIYQVTRPNNEHHNNWQLARLDFEGSLDESNAKLAVRTIKNIDGIHHAYLNQSKESIVYSYTSGNKDADLITNTFNQKTNLNAKRYKPSKESLAKGCPVLDKSSISYRIGTFFQNLFSSNN